MSQKEPKLIPLTTNPRPTKEPVRRPLPPIKKD